MKKRKKKRSFTLVEVLVSISVLGIALIPMLQDVFARATAYKNMHETLVAEYQIEERFSAELAWLATSEEVSFATLENGYRKEHVLASGKRMITEFTIIDAPESETLKASLGQLSVLIEPVVKMDNWTPFIPRSVSIAFEQKM